MSFFHKTGVAEKRFLDRVILICFEAIPSWGQSIFLVLCSESTPGGVMMAISGARGWTGFGQKQSKCLISLERDFKRC